MHAGVVHRVQGGRVAARAGGFPAYRIPLEKPVKLCWDASSSIGGRAGMETGGRVLLDASRLRRLVSPW